MKLLKRLLILCVMTCSIPMYATTPNDVRDTFMHKNINGTLTGGKDITFTLSSTNSIKGIGYGLFSTSNSYVNSSTWTDIGMDKSINLFDNIVYMDYDSSREFNNAHIFGAIDVDGKVYSHMSSDVAKYGNYIRQLEMPEKAVDLASVSYTVWDSIGSTFENGSLYVLGESGHIYSRHPQSDLDVDGLKLFDDSMKYRDIGNFKYVEDTSYKHSVHSLYAITEDNKLYMQNGKGEVALEYTGIDNVDSVYGTQSPNLVYIKYLDGRYMLYNKTSDNLQKIIIPDGVKIQNIVSNTNSIWTFAITNDGIYANMGTDKWALYKTAIGLEPVDVSGSTVLCSDGKYYTVAQNGSYPSVSLVELPTYNDMKPWANTNPIVMTDKLASFRIGLNEIYERGSEVELEYSLVTRDKPTSFNIYYVKSKDMSDRSKWNLIESNITTDKLEVSEYDTGIVDSKGDKILGNTYKYLWNIGNEDLTNIQVIVEPMY